MALIFQNALNFNETRASESAYAKAVIPRCHHMLKYLAWLAQEYLPSIDDLNDKDKDNAALGMIRYSVRDAYRKERMDILSDAPIDKAGMRDCNNLIRKVENRKYSKEFSYFARYFKLAH
jgi:hypothetical protein